ncbi:molybdopterin-dependent oxidoreductase [Candidatus Contubernalis alkaliaceticus]|uniref:molybdopterin-dependent oxidoreductase n=1 Tax=Candidatus Contubernalis alkaliaceticus TaxID=338645 RepID=UPI001F4BDC2C|nr:molybdopterin-dependent oxidoreductase [Candidatus Contubernalis alkalaceticus]UNC91956.1 molybdopterin-dependent oxidoreductase [Candidatus Contubernalis alkalaceticus]
MKGRILTLIVVALLITVGGLAYLNQKQLTHTDQNSENPSVMIKADGEETGVITLEEIKALGEVEFVTTLRSSGKPPSDHTYKGVPLKEVILAVDKTLLEQGEQVTAQAVDGYVVAYTVEEVMESEHIYLVYQQEGEPLKSKNEGGSGPFLVLARQDEFGQRWCKFTVEINIQ